MTAGVPRREEGQDAVETPATEITTPPTGTEPEADADTAPETAATGGDSEATPDRASADTSGDRTGPATPARSHGRQALEWAGLLGGALVIALLVRTFLFQPFYIPTESMYPTLKENDRVLVNKLSYKLHDVHRGDIVVFTAPEGEGDNGIKDLIKRVVGLPGETLEGRGGHVYVDGRLLEEPYLQEGVTTSAFGPQEIPAGALWMMGDNRTQSRDSRFFGPVPESDVVGRAFVRLWPLSRLGLL